MKFVDREAVFLFGPADRVAAVAKVGEPPAGFSFGRTGEGRVGHWMVQTAPHAPSGTHVLAQRDTDRTDNRPASRRTISCALISG